MIDKRIKPKKRFKVKAKLIECLNCKTSRFKLKSKGYCKRCYDLNLRLEKIMLWNFDNQKTLHSYPKGTTTMDIRDFNRVKDGSIKQIRERLSELKFFEQPLVSNVFGENIVPLFQEIAKRAKSKNSDFLWHSENLFDHNFNQKQKKIIYKILLEIKEEIPWGGLDWKKIWSGK